MRREKVFWNVEEVAGWRTINCDVFHESDENYLLSRTIIK